MVDVLTEYGRFLEDDYRSIIDNLYVPDMFEEYTEVTGRRFMIIGGKERPGAIAKSVFLCLKLAGPESIVVSVPNLDEMFLVDNVIETYGKEVRTKIFVAHHDDLKLDPAWRDEIETATDIVVQADSVMAEAWRDYETVDRHVWEYTSKFSFGFIRAEHLTMKNIDKICYDFFSFYGEGRLAPKFYFVLGKPSRKLFEHFSMAMIANYGRYIEQYRAKLPLTRKSMLTYNAITAKYMAKFIQVAELNSDEMFGTLYGDVRLVFIDDLDDVDLFIEEWRDSISTVAIDYDDDPEIFDLLEDHMIIRICVLGEMQYPEFFEQYDAVDDFSVYVSDAIEEIDLDDLT